MEKPECDSKKSLPDKDAAENADISPKSKFKGRGKKRKRRDSDSSSESEEVLPENALEVEKNVIASAVKNNLDDVSVKRILKKVVTNDHVLALVKLREEEEEESSTEESKLRPKLTRAKVKELMKVSPKAAPWNLENLELTPIKHIPVKTRPEVKALIAQELPEDEDDEEYEPTHDDVPSDDDQGLESCSDLDSQPHTPATPRSVGKTSPKVVKDGPFKVPQDVTPARRKLELEEEATIALRTRSKLCLSETPIEHIESSFVPPDDLPVPVVDDHLWNEFLNECLNPASVSKNEDDDETDPEYNVAADPDAPDDDDELERSIIKISKKELNDLVTELFNIMPEQSVDDELANISVISEPPNQTPNRWEGKQEPLSDDETSVKMVDRIVFEQKSIRTTTRLSVGKMETEVSPDCEAGQNETATAQQEEEEEIAQPKLCIVLQQPANVVDIHTIEQRPPPDLDVEPPPAVRQRQPPPEVSRLQVTLNDANTILPEQVLILQQQIRMHVQLATSNFLQLYVHPIHWSYGPTYREYLESLVKMVASNPKSVVNVCNLQPAMELVTTWAETVSEDTPENAKLVEFIQKESERCRRRHANNNPYIGDFHETLMRVMANSCVFLYPHLLPPLPYRPDHSRRFMYMPAEDAYIANGLDEFWRYVEDNPEIYKRPPRYNHKTRWGVMVVAELVVKYMLPWMTTSMLLRHLSQVRKTTEQDNPIRVFFKTGEVTPVKHRLLAFNPKLTLYEQPEYEMPRRWLRYLAKTSKRFRLFLRRRTNVSGREAPGVEVSIGIPTMPTKEALPIDYTPKVTKDNTDSNPELKDKFDITINTYPTAPTNATNVTPNLFKLVETSAGINLIPLQMIPKEPMKVMTLEPLNTNTQNANENTTHIGLQTNTVNCNVTPISSTVECKKDFVYNSSTNGPKPQTVEDPNHCKCCIIMRRFFKPKQKTITDYFRSTNTRRGKCRCINKSYPRITNRLKLLVNRFHRQANVIYKDVKQRLELLKEAENTEPERKDSLLDINQENDLEIVTAFHIKLLFRIIISKNIHLKKRIHLLFSKFDVDHDDPIKLANELNSLFDTELVDFFKEFLVFLTPEQADKMTMFRDYFVHNCVPGLVKKIDEHVTDKEKKLKVLGQLSRLFAGPWTACQMCGVLLLNMQGYPELAAYTFELFPHWSHKK
ncbi:hypothetical protein ABMA28_006139 [Loxostege sticticalis]|uniref:Uncharacterized protein n=1 Tax=Loxostege sticticalis TaxID=481309 RepID=A0ABD0SKT4_LOXSC